MGHRFGGWGWVCGFAALLVIIAAAVLGVVFAPRSVQLSLVLLFFEPAREMCIRDRASTAAHRI